MSEAPPRGEKVEFVCAGGNSTPQCTAIGLAYSLLTQPPIILYCQPCSPPGRSTLCFRVHPFSPPSPGRQLSRPFHPLCGRPACGRATVWSNSIGHRRVVVPFGTGTYVCAQSESFTKTRKIRKNNDHSYILFATYLWFTS